MCVSEEESGERGRQHDHRVDPTATILVGPDAEKDADQRAGQNRRAHQQAELRLVEPEFRFDLDADDGEDRPDRKTYGESDGRQPKCAALTRGARSWLGRHETNPPLLSGEASSTATDARMGSVCFDLDQRAAAKMRDLADKDAKSPVIRRSTHSA